MMMRPKVGVIFEFPASESLADAQKTASMAQLSLLCDDGQVFSALLTRDELLRHICEARAVVKNMDKFAEMVGEEWKKTYARHQSADSSS